MKKILVVDDDPDIRHLLRSILEASNFAVDTVCDGQEAVDWFRTSIPDGIMLDVRMPVMDGLAALALIRHESAAVRVILMSVSRASDFAEEAQARGASAYLASPFDLQELRAVLASAFGAEA